MKLIKHRIVNQKMFPRRLLKMLARKTKNRLSGQWLVKEYDDYFMHVWSPGKVNNLVLTICR